MSSTPRVSFAREHSVKFLRALKITVASEAEENFKFLKKSKERLKKGFYALL